MTTYTIAILNDMLVATAVDGDDTMMAERLKAARAAGIEFEADDLTMIAGLTLYRSRAEAADAEEEGAMIFYSGTDMGWLQDGAGRMDYWAAGGA